MLVLAILLYIFVMLGWRAPKTKRGPEGPLLGSDRDGEGLDAQDRRAARGHEAEEEQEGRNEPVEFGERHDTHLEFVSVWTPGERGCPFRTRVQ